MPSLAPSMPLRLPLWQWLAARFELGRHGGATNLKPMEGLRGFAVLLVFLVHFTTLGMPWLPGGEVAYRLWMAVHEAGHAGVDLFFVLSGYLIYGSLISRPRPFGPYLRRRLQRIYPTFLAVFALYVALSLALPSQSKLPPGALDAARYLLINLALLPGVFPFEPMITVAWSLSYEMFFYLALPLAIAALRLRRWSSAQRCLLAGALALAIAAYCALHTGHVRMVLFLAGIVLHEALAARRAWRVGDAAIWAALAAGLVFAVLRPGGSASYALRALALCAAFFIVCYGCFSQPHGGAARAFSWTPLRWLGNMSYSYYLIHGLALKAVFAGVAWLAAPASPSWAAIAALFVLAFAATLLPSALLYLAIERPLSLAPPRPQPRRAGSDAAAAG